MKMTAKMLIFLLMATALSAAEKIDIEAGRQHWAFQPIQKPALPEVKNAAWAVNPIDRFILARLEKAGLKPSAPATMRDLQRRIYFDLIGLPPPVEPSGKYPETIDKLLASPHYGERWGRHWLDVVRYADSNGLDENAAHANAWRYRDYVVRAFNADKPFNQFIIEQLAGDRLPTKDEAQRREQFIATGYLSLGPKVLAEPDKMKMEMDIIDEQINILGQSFLGITLGCARCHEHKFDPIPIEDYYSLAGIFKSTKTMTSLKTIAKWHEYSLATPAEKKLREKHDALVAAQKKVITAFTAKANQQLLVEKKLEKLPKEPEAQYPKATGAQLEMLRASLRQLEASPPPLPSAMGVSEGSVTNLAVHIRGSHLKLGEVQPRRFLQVLSPAAPKPLGEKTSGRLGLARQIASEDNPLTARVFVNRIWRWHFGRGLVGTPDNFGTTGDRPTHPELLDWLAGWFMENGWSVKKLHRLILASATYQMSSQAPAASLKADPDNQLYSRAPLRRLEAEPLRDAMLEISGLLDRQVGGSIWTFENYKLVFNHTSEDATTYDGNRRSIYLPVIRNHVYDLFELFDFPNPNMMSGDRAATTIAPQALFLMNSPLTLRVTEALAKRLLGQKKWQDVQRVEWLYQLAYHRAPTPVESRHALGFVKQFAATSNCGDADKDRLMAWQALSQAVISANEFLYLK
jgi:hypothetical protein